jgi:hypothetical protein
MPAFASSMAVIKPEIPPPTMITLFTCNDYALRPDIKKTKEE